MSVDVGQVIAGKYELVRLLGRGAMGEVWVATHASLGGEFALKVVTPTDDVDASAAAGRFQLEAQISAKLSRKTRHVVSVSDHGEEDGVAYLVMELLEGKSLEARLDEAGPLPLPEVVAIVAQVARALATAHGEGIFHRDIKPANVFLTRDEDGRLLVKLLDFGIARVDGRAEPIEAKRRRSPFETGKDMVLGTPSYMSPEQARGLPSLDYRCDVWGLAVVAYEAICDEIPWDGETVEDIFLSVCTHRMNPILGYLPGLPPALEDVFLKAFTPKLEERFQRVQDLAAALEAIVPPEDIEAAVGGRTSPSSARRLPTESHPILRAGGTEEPRSDPLAVSWNDATGSTRKRRGVGWVWAISAALATLGLVIVSLVVYRPGRAAQAEAAPPTASVLSKPPTPPATSTTAVAAPTPDRAPEPTATTSALAVTRRDARPPRRDPPKRVAPPAVAPPPATAAAPTPAPDVAKPTPAVTPPPDKAAIF